jgi:hypothetical protein
MKAIHPGSARRACLAFALLIGLPALVFGEFKGLLLTHGEASFASYVHGGQPDNGNPGYRSDLRLQVDFFRWGGLISELGLANSTVIEREDTSIFRLNRIRYTVAPGFRKEFESWIVHFEWFHESIHAIGRLDDGGGSVWWNSARVNFGTKGAYQPFVVNRYQGDADRPERLDYKLQLGAFLYNQEPIVLARNNDYRYEESFMLRYHLGKSGRWGSFADVSQAYWVRAQGPSQQKWSATINLFVSGRENLAGLYYTYVFWDDHPADNENYLGSVGFKVVF